MECWLVWFWLPVPNERDPAPGPGYYGALLCELAVDSARLFFSCQRFAQICGSSGYFVISGVSWSSHHEKKGRGQPRPRTNWAAIGLVPLHSGKGRTRKETYWVLAGLSIARGNPAKACTWQGPGEPPPKYPAGTPGGWHVPRPKASGISTSPRNCPELLTVCSGREE
ncbi:uncharacterized protein TrAtP1_007976 [Trichoderma atroviride]|uniref:uncharacterized protein n=1 Tax=Hypocrea atroviridis TaxID=63577 RepID=UPI003321658E|nr:hypothetical protein TrAtP1_007976 [Trichoderma atroviride]